MPYKDPQKKKEYSKRYYQEHKEERKEYYQEHKQEKKEYYQEHKQEKKEYYQEHKEESQNYYQEHKQEKKEYNKEYGESHRKERNIYKRRCRSSLRGKLDNNMGRSIWKALRGIKAGRKWETLVGYTVQDLIEHLESLFAPWMSWDNYGKYEEGKLKWHIDHLRPQSLFHYETAEDPEFRKCWALENLQPLEAIANIKKSNHYE